MALRKRKIFKMLEQFKPQVRNIENYLESFLQKSLRTPRREDSIYAGLDRLTESIRYGVFGCAKRFRPLLSVLVAKTLEQPEEKVLPLGVAVELIHSYSLIHDDLPSMDNDNQRRGRPTNHRVYGETTALLAGDALQSEAFQCLAWAYRSQPKIAVELILLLSEATGVQGIVGGQAMDLEAEDQETADQKVERASSSLESMYDLHRMKTGSLIRVSIEGAAVACEASEETRSRLRKFGEKLGLAFQLADDILDYSVDHPEKSGFPYFMGLEKTRSQLTQITNEAMEMLSPLGEAAKSLRDLTQWNAWRAEGQ